MISNALTFYEIAKQSWDEGQKLKKSAHKPKPNDEKGFIIDYHKQTEAYKKFLVVISFCGIHYEARIYLKGIGAYGKQIWENYYDKLNYEAKLHLLGCRDQSLLNACRQFMKARNDLVHEKAISTSKFNQGKDTFQEAKNAISFITELNHKISQLNDNIYEIFLLSMGPNMYNNLLKISSENFGSYKNLKNNSGLERELYYLRDIGYIEVPQIRELPEKGNNLSDYVKITELGKQFVFYRENYLKLKFKDLR